MAATRGMHSRRALAGVASGLLAAALVSGPRPGRAGTPLEEIVVSARKLVEPVVTTPLAVDVVAADRIVTGDVDGLASLSLRLPGLSFESLWGGLGSAPVLRGLSQPSTAGDNVGVFVDAVYQASRAALNVDPFDLERIEVARGPQSALFGQSTFAGAIHYVPRAPTATLDAGLRVDVGSEALAGVYAHLSGPLGGTGWRARIAAGRRESGGTFDDAVDGHDLGGQRRDSLALSLEYGDPSTWTFRAAARHADASFGHPAQFPIEGPHYDCGARDPATGYWSYRCARVPLEERVSISPDLPDSRQRASQLVLRAASARAPWQLFGDVSYYGARSRTDRDFDGGRGGVTLGVCRTGATCGASSGTFRPVERLVTVDVLSEGEQRLSQWSGELWLAHDPGTRHRWTLGLAAWSVRDRNQAAFALARSVLGAGEQLTALLPATPQRVGPVSQFNRTLVGDPARERAVNALTVSDRDMLAVFGTWDYVPADGLALRAELRAARERERLDGVIANGLPGIGRAVPRQSFDDVTPRFSVAWTPDGATTTWLSAAKGSRSGGVNLVPGLDPAEQGFEPETNWTWEAGLRRAGAGAARGLRVLQLVAYYVDWRNVQLTGFPTTPGVVNLLTRNTTGIVSRGLEAALAYAPWASLQLDLALSLADPRFRAGSEDLGSRVFCGLGVSATSTLCTIGPSRDPGAAAPTLVPWIDGNRPNRAPERMAAFGITFAAPRQPFDGRLRLRIDLGWQDDVYDRAINGLSYGERTLLDARLSWSRGPWSVELWGRNLADDRYLAAAGARGPAFHPTTPRPIDLLYGEGRRYGLSLGWRSAGDPR